MSHMQKALAKLQRTSAPAFGFGAARREQPKQLLLAVEASDAKAIDAAIAAGADLAVVAAADGAAAATIIKASGHADRCGARLEKHDEAGAKALHDAGAIFAIATPEGTEAVSVDTEALGYIASLDIESSDADLRAIGGLGLDGITVAGAHAPQTLAEQLKLVRLAQLGGASLLLSVDPGTTTAQLRTLRDAGATIVIAPAGTDAKAIEALVAQIKAVPPRKRGREGHEIAIIPSTAAAHAEEEHEHEEDE